MTSDEHPKLLYVAHRHPRFGPETFTARWRAHAALGMRQTRWRNVALYLHCDRDDGLPADIPALDGDGMAVVVYRNETARLAHITDADARRTMKADELETFAHPVAQSSLMVRQQVLRPAPLEGWRLFVCHEGVATEPVASQGTGVAADSAALRADAIGHVHNHVTAALGPWTCSGVEEFTAPDATPLVALARRLLQAGQSVERLRMMLTRTVVLHDQPLLPGA